MPLSLSNDGEALLLITLFAKAFTGGQKNREWRHVDCERMGGIGQDLV